MNHLYTFLALDLARDRAREAAEARRATQLPADQERPNALRRGLATSLAVVSRSAITLRASMPSLATHCSAFFTNECSMRSPIRSRHSCGSIFATWAGAYCRSR